MPLLALFDVDGTLFLAHDPTASEAMLGTLGELYGVTPPADAVERVDHPGQTAKRIARYVLRAEGLDHASVDEQLDRWCALFAARYLELLPTADTSGWEVQPGAAEALLRLQVGGVQLALLTGNPEPMARARMERLGLAGFFPEGQGAFGCDAEARSELLGLARARAGGRPAGETVAVGDTPRDAASAHEAGIRAVVIPSASTAGQHFPGADAVCDDMGAVAEQLLAWAGELPAQG
jgi:phosphoglycolate phosphatase-like HAD superfamily hydrolase